MFEDRPKLLGDVHALASRLRQVTAPHVALLNDYVQDLRNRMGPKAAIPYFDPWDGGVEADVLLLLEAPGPRAVNSGFVSQNNQDETAKNLFELSKEAGLNRKRVVVWNVVPWYIGNGSRIRAANAGDIAQGRSSLDELLALLPNLKAVVLFGNKAQKAEDHIKKRSSALTVFFCPHPSPMFVNRSPKKNREIILQKLKETKEFIDGGRNVLHGASKRQP